MADDSMLRRDYAAAIESPASAHVSDDAWERLATGSMSHVDRQAVIEHIVGCASCTTIYRALGELEAGARQFDPGAKSMAAPWYSTRAVYAIAASLALVTVGAIAYQMLRASRDTPRQVATAPPQPVISLQRIPFEKPDVRLSASRALTTRSNADTTAFLADFAGAIQPYRDGRYAEATRALATVAAAYPEAYEPAFYQGVSLILSGAGAEAVDPLARAERLADDASRDEIRWYRAAALQLAGRADQAHALVMMLCQSGGVWRDRACPLLDAPAP